MVSPHDHEDGDEDHDESSPAVPFKNLMTPQGHAMLYAELQHLTRNERPKIVEIVSWAAGNGDRTENGDYIYNKKRLREIDRRIRYLTKRLEKVEIVDPRRQQGVEQVFFGATVTYLREDETEITVKLVSIDEADAAQGKINWQSPVARALMKSRIGDTVRLRVDNVVEVLEIIDVVYLIEE